MTVGLDEKKTQHAGLAFDVNSSLISVEVTGGPEQALQLATRCFQYLVRVYDSVLLLKNICALLLPSTPFSGAQALAGQVSLLLTDVPCALQVYHGATALMIIQSLQEAGARTLSFKEYAEMAGSSPEAEFQARPERRRPASPGVLPYLAFLMSYPSPRLLRLFPYELACRYQCVPLGSEDNMLTLATYQWLDREIITHLHSATRREIFQVRCEMLVIDEVLCYWRHLRDIPISDSPELERNTACSSIS